jgi:hypothetical protein
MNDLPSRKAVSDEFSASFVAFLDQRRIVVGHRLIERQGRRYAIFVQHRQNTEDTDTVPILVVAVTTDVGEGRLVAAS